MRSYFSYSTVGSHQLEPHFEIVTFVLSHSTLGSHILRRHFKIVTFVPSYFTLGCDLVISLDTSRSLQWRTVGGRSAAGGIIQVPGGAAFSGSGKGGGVPVSLLSPASLIRTHGGLDSSLSHARSSAMRISKRGNRNSSEERTRILRLRTRLMPLIDPLI